MLTDHDYDNMQYIAKYAKILNALIKKYSMLDIQYPSFSYDQIRAIPNDFIVKHSFDSEVKHVVFHEKELSESEKFVLLYLKTIELVQICIDIYNEFERKA